MSSSASEFANLRISFQDVVSATNNFDDNNLIKAGGTANVYKGKLFLFGEWIDVAVRSVLPQHRLNPDDFLEEVKALSGLKHKNIISVVGFCDENGQNIIIMGYAVKGSLDQYLSDPTAITWSQRLKICLDATRGFQFMTHEVYNHPGNHTCTYPDIRCSKILLDKDGEAKISCFGLAKNKYGDMIGYPLGLMYLQVIYGREVVVGDDQFVAAMAEHGFLKKKLDEFIDPTLNKQIHPLSFTIFLQTAYECLTNRSMSYSDLHNTVNGVDDALEVQKKHEYIEKNMAHLKIPLCDLEAATNNFSDSCQYENIYKAELGPLDCKSSSPIEKTELFNRRITVAIQRISYDKMRRANWFFEGFEMLTTCKHDKIASLLGFSWEGNDMILVFEYPLKGSLHDYLGSANIRNSLTWKQRVQISLDIAHGLDYICNKENKLLTKFTAITSSSIFLDDKWNAKIVSIKLGESYQKGSLIYSFGVVLFEILFGQLADDALVLAKEANWQEHIPLNLLDEQTQWEMVHQDSLDAF